MSLRRVKMDKQQSIIRDSLNFIIIFKQNASETKDIYKNHVNTDMKFNKFKELCDKCWKDKLGFIVIAKESDINNGRYRKGFHEFFIIDQNEENNSVYFELPKSKDGF